MSPHAIKNKIYKRNLHWDTKSCFLLFVGARGVVRGGLTTTTNMNNENGN